MNKAAVYEANLAQENAYRQEKFAQGETFQRYITEWFRWQEVTFRNYETREEQLTLGENTLGMEIKRDGLFRDTGNLYIEYREKSYSNSVRNAYWTPSGCCRDDSSWLYLIGDEDTFWIFARKRLQQLLNKDRYETRTISRGTSQGFLLPLQDADKECARKVEIAF